MEKLTPEMKQVLVTIPDLSQQPASEYVLITGQLPRPMYIAVDGYHVQGDSVIEFFRMEESGHCIIVYVCRVKEGQWALVKRNAVFEVTKEELVRHTSTDSDETNRILKEIDPDMFEAAEKMMKEQGISIGGSVEKPVPGQYL